MRTAAHKVVERAVLGCVAVICVGTAVVAHGYGLSDRLGPGTGFFPFWLAVIGALLCAGLLALSVRGHAIGEGGEASWPDRAGAVRALILLAALGAAAFALQPLGFRLTAAGFTALLLLALGVRRPVVIALFALVASVGLFHAFYYWLKVPLPIGIFGF